MATDPYDFAFPWRPNFEMNAALGWGGASVASLGLSLLAPQPLIGMGPAALCAVAGLWRGAQAFQRETERNRLNSDGIDFITAGELVKIAKKAAEKKAYWLGYGFPWTDIEATRLHHIISEGAVKVLGELALKEGGSWWIHGLQKEAALTSDLGHLVGHTVVGGTTRVGKSRLADLLIGQAIVRGECVILEDPKNEGLAGLAGNMKRVCEEVGAPERFAYFNLAFPESSIRLDLLRNYAAPTELASRLSALIPSESGGDTFVNFNWSVLNAHTLGMLYVGEKPTLKRYRYYTESGVAALLLQCVLKFFDETQPPDWDASVLLWAKNRGMLKGKQGDDGEILVRQSLNLLLAYYAEAMVPNGFELEAIDALTKVFRHPAEHYEKMTTNMRPILQKLTTGVLGELLSPDPLDVTDPRPVTDMRSLIDTKAAVYIGLNSLADAAVGFAVGSLINADLAAVAGNRNNYTPDDKSPINLHLDEVVETLTDQVIQLMNKGGGSGFRVTIYTQTFADFAAKLGNEFKARQVLGNANNRIAFRILDAESQKYIVDGIPLFMLKKMGVRYGTNVDTRIHDEFTASYQEQIVEQEADLFPAAMLGELPPLHFIARLSGGQMRKGRIPILGERKAA